MISKYFFNAICVAGIVFRERPSAVFLPLALGLCEVSILLIISQMIERYLGNSNSLELLSKIFSPLDIKLLILILLLLAIARILLSINIIKFAHRSRIVLTNWYISNFTSLSFEDYLDYGRAKFLKIIMSEVDQLVGFFVLPIMNATSGLINIFLIMLVVIFLAPKIYFYILFALIFSFTLAFILVRKALLSGGGNRIRLNEERQASSIAVYDNFPELRVYNAFDFFKISLNSSVSGLANTLSSLGVISTFPRLFIEFTIYLAFSILIYCHTLGLDFLQYLDINSVVLMLFASMRLIPYGQQVFNAMSQLRFGIHAIDEYVNGLESMKMR